MQRADSYEVQPEQLKNFVVSLKSFIDRENIPNKKNLLSVLAELTLEKIESNHLIFPQGSQLIFSQMNRLFGF